MRSVLKEDARRLMPCTKNPLSSRKSARYAPSCPVMPVINARFSKPHSRCNVYKIMKDPVTIIYATSGEIRHLPSRLACGSGKTDHGSLRCADTGLVIAPGERRANREQGLHPGRPRENPAQNSRALRDSIPGNLRRAGMVCGKVPQLEPVIPARPRSADREAHGLPWSSRPLDPRQRMDPDI